MATDQNCKLCLGTGWVCECTLSQPFEGEGSCGCGGCGKNCLCNPNGDWPTGGTVLFSVNDVVH